MTATIWHRHDRLKNNEEGFFFPTPNCPSSSAIQYVDAWNVNLEVHVTTWLTLLGAKKLTLQCYAGKLTPLDDANTRVENSSWHCLKITTKCLITIYERSELRLLIHWSVEITTTIPRLWITALKSPLRYLYFIDFSVEVSHYFGWLLLGSVEDYSFNALISVVPLLFFQLWILRYLNATSHREWHSFRWMRDH